MGKERFEILLEEIKGQSQLALEGHDVIRREMQQQGEDLGQEMREMKAELKAEIKKVDNKVDAVHSSLKKEIQVTALAVKSDLQEDIRRVEVKLDQHIKQPAHA